MPLPDLQDSVLSGQQQQADMGYGQSSSSGEEMATPHTLKKLSKNMVSKDHLLTEEALARRKKEKRERRTWKKYLDKLNREREAVRNQFYNKYYWHTYVDKIPKTADNSDLPRDMENLSPE